MINRKSLLAALFSIVFAQTVLSQGLNTFSPYSRFGLGELRARGFANSRAMGGISQGVNSGIAINNLNPASYTAQDSMSFILDFGLEGKGTYYSYSDNSLYFPTMNFHHVAVQFPLTKWWGASLGIQPYSDMGYKLRFVETNPYLLSTIGAIKYNHYGQGGISQAYMGNAFKTFKGLSIGANVSYFFGSLDYHTDVIFPAGSVYTNVYRNNSVVVRSLAYSVGAQYQFQFGGEKQYKIILGATLDNEASMAAERILHTSTTSTMVDTIQYVSTKNGSIDMPQNISGGFTFSYSNKLSFGVDYAIQDWTNAKFLEVSDSLTKSNTLRFGVQYTPNPTDFKSYLKRMTYRAGFYQSNTYLVLRNNQVKDYGITFGVGLPLRRTSTSFNVSFEFGKRGSISNGLINENYGIVNLGITFYDIWFVKRKYN
jgi:hypothetical protein